MLYNLVQFFFNISFNSLWKLNKNETLSLVRKYNPNWLLTDDNMYHIFRS